MSDGAGVEARLCCKLNDLVIRSVFQRRDGKKVGETGQTVGMVVSTEVRNNTKTGNMDLPGSQMKVIQSKITEILQRPTVFVSYSPCIVLIDWHTRLRETYEKCKRKVRQSDIRSVKMEDMERTSVVKPPSVHLETVGPTFVRPRH